MAPKIWSNCRRKRMDPRPTCPVSRPRTYRGRSALLPGNSSCNKKRSLGCACPGTYCSICTTLTRWTPPRGVQSPPPAQGWISQCVLGGRTFSCFKSISCYGCRWPRHARPEANPTPDDDSSHLSNVSICKLCKIAIVQLYPFFYSPIFSPSSYFCELCTPELIRVLNVW